MIITPEKINGKPLQNKLTGFVQLPGSEGNIRIDLSIINTYMKRVTEEKRFFRKPKITYNLRIITPLQAWHIPYISEALLDEDIAELDKMLGLD